MIEFHFFFFTNFSDFGKLLQTAYAIIFQLHRALACTDQNHLAEISDS